MHQDHVNIGPRDGGLRDAGQRPLDLPASRGGESNLGSGELEIVVLIRLHNAHTFGMPQLVEVLQRIAGGFPGIVPALEGGQHDRHAFFARRRLQQPLVVTGFPIFDVHHSDQPTAT